MERFSSPKNKKYGETDKHEDVAPAVLGAGKKAPTLEEQRADQEARSAQLRKVFAGGTLGLNEVSQGTTSEYVQVAQRAVPAPEIHPADTFTVRPERGQVGYSEELDGVKTYHIPGSSDAGRAGGRR